MSIEPNEIRGAAGETILVDTHRPPGPVSGVALIAHGFKGYKDYGMFPAIARTFAEAGMIAHRFNFSHSGMTNDIDTFARADLFERDTWNRQVEDLEALTRGIANGDLAGEGLPLVLFGHSRGGVAVLLAAGRGGLAIAPAGVITAAAPSRCNSLEPDQVRRLLDQGWIESPSSRTGQALRVGRAFLQEQMEDPAGHDLLAVVARIECPLLVIHGGADPTVDPACAHLIAGAATAPAETLVIEGANHVFDTPNPMPDEAAPSAALRSMLNRITSWLGERLAQV